MFLDEMECIDRGLSLDSKFAQGARQTGPTRKAGTNGRKYAELGEREPLRGQCISVHRYSLPVEQQGYRGAKRQNRSNG